MKCRRFISRDGIPSPDPAAKAAVIAMGQSYMEHHVPAEVSMGRQIYNQLHFLSPWLWAVQFLTLIFVGTAAWPLRDGQTTAGEIMMLLAPFTAFLGLPELLKGSACGVLELELSCKYSGGTLFLIRLLLIGAINTLGILLCAALCSSLWDTGFVSTLLCGLIPANGVYFFSVLIFRIFRFHSRLAVLVCSLLAGMISSVLFRQLRLVQWSAGLQIAAYGITCVLLAVVFSQERRRIDSRKEVGIWNFA